MSDLCATGKLAGPERAADSSRRRRQLVNVRLEFCPESTEIIQRRFRHDSKELRVLRQDVFRKIIEGGDKTLHLLHGDP